MQAADICDQLVPAVHHVWKILKEKDMPWLFSVMKVAILLDYLCG